MAAVTPLDDIMGTASLPRLRHRWLPGHKLAMVVMVACLAAGDTLIWLTAGYRMGLYIILAWIGGAFFGGTWEDRQP